MLPHVLRIKDKLQTLSSMCYTGNLCVLEWSRVFSTHWPGQGHNV